MTGILVASHVSSSSCRRSIIFFSSQATRWAYGGRIRRFKPGKWTAGLNFSADAGRATRPFLGCLIQSFASLAVNVGGRGLVMCRTDDHGAFHGCEWLVVRGAQGERHIRLPCP